MIVKDRIEGVVLGLLMDIKDDTPFVIFAGNPHETAIAARSLAALSKSDIGAEIALLFENGSLRRPLIIGKIIDPTQPKPQPLANAQSQPVVISDGEPIKIEAQQRLELRCGKSAVILEADGHITIRGSHLVSHASASNKIRGGSIDLN